MSFIELIIFASLSVAMGFLGKFLADHWNPLGWIVVLPVIYLWLKLLGSTIKSLSMRDRENQMPRPVCFKGKCQSKDYALVEKNPTNSIFICRCGDKYRSQGTYFARVMPLGSIQPYMVRQRNGEWKPDNGSPSR